MRPRRGGRSLLQVVVCILVAGVLVVPVGADETAERGPIRIWGDDAFSAENGVVGGAGTESDPYVIEGWTVRVEGAGHSHTQTSISYDQLHTGTEDVDASSNGIHLQGTRAHVVIRDVTVQGAGFDAHGILLEDTRNVRIEDVRVTRTDYGIYVVDSRDVHVQGTIADDNLCDMELRRSHGVVLRGNILGGTFHGFGIRGSEPEHYRHDIDASNTVGGSPIRYWRDVSDQTLDADGAWFGIIDARNVSLHGARPAANIQGIVAVGSRDVLIEGAEVTTQHGNGIDVIASQRVQVRNGTVRGSEEAGVFVLGSTQVEIAGLQASGNGLAVSLLQGSGLTLRDAVLENNSMAGVHQHSGRHSGVDVRLADSVLLENLTVRGHEGPGLRIVGPAPGLVARGLVLEGNGVGIEAAALQDARFSGVRVTGGQQAATFERSAVELRGLQVAGSDAGLHLLDAAGTAVDGATFEGAGRAIDVRTSGSLGAYDIRFTNSTVAGHPVTYLRGIEDRTVTGHHGYLAIVDGQRIALDNVSAEPAGQGILLAGGQAIEVRDGFLEGHGSGIEAAGTQGLVVRGTRLVANDVGIQLGRGTAKALIDGAWLVGAGTPVRVEPSASDVRIEDSRLFTFAPPGGAQHARWHGNAYLPPHDGAPAPRALDGAVDAAPRSWPQGPPIEVRRDGREAVFTATLPSWWTTPDGRVGEGTVLRLPAADAVDVYALDQPSGSLASAAWEPVRDGTAPFPGAALLAVLALATLAVRSASNKP